MNGIISLYFNDKFGCEVSETYFISSERNKMKRFKISIDMCSDVDATKTQLYFICSSNIFNLFVSESRNIVDMKSVKGKFVEITRIVGDIQIKSLVVKLRLNETWNKCFIDVID